MPTLVDRILDALASSAAPLDDDQLALRLGVSRQQVNRAARALADRGRVVRGPHPATGKLVSAVPPRPAPPSGRRLVVDALGRLAKVRPIFHSEADFQHALAVVLHELGFRVRLEVRPFPAESVYLDMLVHGPPGRLAIELKYLTGRLSAVLDDEVFSLREQGALDLRRYDVVRDVARLERLVLSGKADHGVVVVLTNAAACWTAPVTSETFDRSFRIHQGAVLEGRLRWAQGTGEGTMKGRADGFVLRGRYELDWLDYSVVVGTRSASRFRALVVPVAV